uniref:FAD dependent oxidoreductase domain-containing protein n=1 Tax=Acrobeloides nanus TaxID=290746 RepID=A0A914DUK8_9BILA
MKIAVVGQGVIGLSSALAILETFPHADIVIFGDRPFEKCCSYGPAGHFRVDRLSSKRWGRIAHERFAKLDREYPGNETGVKLVPCYMQSDSKKTLDDQEEYNADIVYNFRWLQDREKNSLFVEPSQYCIHFTSYASEGRKYVPWLKRQLEAKGVKFVNRELKTLDELADEGYTVIINCAGLHGGKLAGDDDTVFPLRGVAFEVDAPWHKYCLYRDFVTFTLPLENTVLLGSVRQPHRYDLEITDVDRKDILDRYYKLHPAMKSAKIIREWCGLRPDRPDVRLEHQIKKTPKGKPYHVIHNYGHGGNGFTLHWGCATDVVDYVKKIGQERSKL